MYVIESSISSGEPIMLLNYPIGMDPESSSNIDGALFQRELLELDGLGLKRIQIWINCPGGNVYEGYNICNAILKSKTPVDTYVAGIAASMAGAVFMCGRQRIMTDYSSLMIHNPYDPAGGTDKKQLDAMKSSLVTMISAKCNLTPENVGYLCDRETWIGSAECFEKGFATGIEVTKESNQKRMPLVTATAMWKEANKINNISNSIVNTIPIMETATTPAAKINTSILAAYLGLNVEATENSVLTEVKNRISVLTLAKVKADDDMEDMKKQIATAKAALDAMTAKYEAKVKEMEDAAAASAAAIALAKTEQETAAKAAVVTSAKAMVSLFVGKKIKTEEAAKWEETAVAVGVDTVKGMLEALPTNATAVSAVNAAKVVDKDGKEIVTIETTAMGMQAKINARLKNERK